MADSVEYLMILNIQKITRTTIRNSSYNSSGPTETTTKSEVELVKLVIRDSYLNRLIERGGQHLALVHDEATNVVDTTIGKPRA